MCNPNSSSKWMEDTAILNKYPNTSISIKSIANQKWPLQDELWEYLETSYSKIRLLHFAGGEPLAHKKHHELLQKLIDRGVSKHIYLKYNTNITLLPDFLFEMWAQFRKVDLWCSIDGVEELNDYIRYPSKWSVILESLDKLDATPDNINVRINCTLGVLNVEFIPELYTFINTKNYKKIGKINGTLHIAPDLIYEPDYLNMRVLSNIDKIRISNKLLAHIAAVDNVQYKSQLQYVISYMNAESWHDASYPRLLTYISELDTLRGNKYPYLYLLNKSSNE
jgi:sulfatase maturation enzyme AslB (radical SAM superfamily)